MADDASAPTSGPQHGEYLRSLPIGEEISPRTDFFTWSTFPFDRDVNGRVKTRTLEPPVLPEPARKGEAGPADCFICQKPDARYLWADEHWRVAYPHEREGALALVFLEPRIHADLHELPADRLAELGPMIARVERALSGLEDVGRVHIHRWGDGAAHFHLWFIARPAGMLQMRGAFGAVWADVLPQVSEEYFRATNARIAAALAQDGGVAQVC